MSTLEDYLKQTKDLTIMPPVLLSVLTLKDDNEMHFSQLEKMVESDQILVSRMLRMANSPFYSRGNRVQNIRQIIGRLGFKTVRSMVAMAFVDSIFSAGNYKKFRQEVWQHSIATGIMAGLLCEDLGLKKHQDSSLLGGLLQDLGKIILNTIDRKKYIQVLTTYLDSDKTIRELEMEHFKVDNVQMGEASEKHWKIPIEIVEIIAGHHDDIAKQKVHVQIVAFSDLLARKAGFGKVEPATEETYSNYLDVLGIAPNKREQMPERFRMRLMEDELYKFCSAL